MKVIWPICIGIEDGPDKWRVDWHENGTVAVQPPEGPPWQVALNPHPCQPSIHAAIEFIRSYQREGL
jgi:hypothetical protein